MITTPKLFELISEHLAHKEPLSVIRYGDGEYLVMTGIGQENPIHAIPYNKHLGYIPDYQIRKQISNNLYESIYQADIIGVTQNTGSKWNKTNRFFMDLINDKKHCSADYHTEMLINGYLDKLLKKAENLAIVTGHDLSKPLKRRYPNLKNILWYQIPLQHNYFGQQKNNHFPHAYHKVIDGIKISDLKGFLCLVGAGFVGKPYINHLKASGGIAVDIGSVFDRLAGHITRGKNKGLKDTTYNL